MPNSTRLTAESIISDFAPFAQSQRGIDLLGMMRESTVLRLAPLLAVRHAIDEVSMLLDYHSGFSMPLWKAERDLDYLTIILSNDAYQRTGRVWRVLEEFVYLLEDKGLISSASSDGTDAATEKVVLGAYVYWDAMSEYPDIDHARWIGDNYALIAPIRNEIIARQSASRGTIEALLESASPALSSGSL